MTGPNITFRSLTTWPTEKTPAGKRRNSPFHATWKRTIDLLEDELNRLRANNVVIEADCDQSEIRIDGHFRANAKLRGPGVVLSFDSPTGSLRFPCDAFNDWQANVRAIALSLEALRTVNKYGVTRRSEQYQGWTALPDKRQETKSAIDAAVDWMIQKSFQFGVAAPNADQIKNDAEVRKSFYRMLAMRLHPDRGNGDADFKTLQNLMTVFPSKD